MSSHALASHRERCMNSRFMSGPLLEVVRDTTLRVSEPSVSRNEVLTRVLLELASTQTLGRCSHRSRRNSAGFSLLTSSD